MRLSLCGLVAVSLWLLAGRAGAEAPKIDFRNLPDEAYDQSKVKLEQDVLPGAPKVVLIAGRRSHGPGDHEFFAGTALLQKLLVKNGVNAVMVRDGWPKDEKVFADAKAIMFFCDGGGGHPLIQYEKESRQQEGVVGEKLQPEKSRGDQRRLKLVQGLLKQGAGFACYHYGVEFPKNDGPAILPMLGGYFEPYWSVNPHWLAKYAELPKHETTRGVKPFEAQDEWYYHMRFVEGMKGVTPILTAVPPDGTRGKPGANEPHGGNPHVQARKGQPEHMAWAYEREDGGRSFGFTGAHFHRNFGDENFRRLVVNSLMWVAKVPVPEGGADVAIEEKDLVSNLDDKRTRRRQ